MRAKDVESRDWRGIGSFWFLKRGKQKNDGYL
jgi:hypothetical protein